MSKVALRHIQFAEGVTFMLTPSVGSARRNVRIPDVWFSDIPHFPLELALPSSSSIRFNKSAVSSAFRWASTIETTL